jgi:hypothetical protein
VAINHYSIGFPHQHRGSMHPACHKHIIVKGCQLNLSYVGSHTLNIEANYREGVAGAPDIASIMRITLTAADGVSCQSSF